MRITIVRDDNLVIVDERAATIDVSDLPSNLHALQWRGETGEVEFNDGTPNEIIANITQYQRYINVHQEIIAKEDEPPPPPTEHEKYSKLIMQRDQKLAETDWLVMRHLEREDLYLAKDKGIKPALYDNYIPVLEYRQHLRDLPQHHKTSDKWQWPEEPKVVTDALAKRHKNYQETSDDE